MSPPFLKVTLWCLIIAAQILSMPFVLLVGDRSAPKPHAMAGDRSALKTYAMAGGVFVACMAAGFAVDSL